MLSVRDELGAVCEGSFGEAPLGEVLREEGIEAEILQGREFKEDELLGEELLQGEKLIIGEGDELL